MPKLTSKVNFPYDGAMVLRRGEDGPETTTGTEAPIALPHSGDAYWQNPEVAFELVNVVIDVQDVNDPANNSYVIEVEVAEDEAFSTGVTTIASTQNLIDGKKVIALPLHRTQFPPKAKFMRVKHNVSGSASPSITYAAWLAPAEKGGNG